MPRPVDGFCVELSVRDDRQGMRGMSWTDERVELLKKLWSDGLSASQIAGELGGFRVTALSAPSPPTPQRRASQARPRMVSRRSDQSPGRRPAITGAGRLARERGVLVGYRER